jgi:hypothetical protein
MSDLVTELGRSFVRVASRELNLYDRYARFYRYWREVNRTGKCVDADELLHHVDNVFIPILENTNQLAVAVSNEVPRYYRNRFTKALGARDKGFIRWFLRNYVLNYTDVDAVVSQNYQILPCFFGFCFSFCPVNGGSCASNASYSCISPVLLPQSPSCCTGSYITPAGAWLNLVDNAPWISNYSTGDSGVSPQIPSSPGVFTITGSFKGPSCFPSSGVALDLDLDVGTQSCPGGTCSTSCPSGSACCSSTAPYCPGSTYTTYDYPVLYYNIGLTVLPNSTYSVWWQASVS